MKTLECSDKTLSALAACHPVLKEALEEELRDWEPDPVPPTLAAALMARRLCSHLHLVDQESLMKVIEFVETTLGSDDELANAIMATGFLEALISTEDRGEANATRVLEALGPEARAYCRAWREFTEGASP